MIKKYILPCILIIVLSGCASIKQHTKDVLLYQQNIILNIVSILSNNDVDENTEMILYDYEDRINEDCHSLQQALVYKIHGKELTDDLKNKIFSELDNCENTVQEAELYIINENLLD